MTALLSTAKLLLIVEDDDTARGCLFTLLHQGDYIVSTAANGREALDKLRNGRIPDLILIDLLMAVMDGWHLIRQLKALPFLATVPIIVVTGANLTPEWALAHGCAGILHKPIDPDAMLQEVRRCAA
jgi:CheY-like chemotaxis protein